MLDENGKAWIIEINNNPSLNINFESGFMDSKTSEPSPIDKDIKKPLVKSTLVMAQYLRKGGVQALDEVEIPHMRKCLSSAEPLLDTFD